MFVTGLLLMALVLVSQARLVAIGKSIEGLDAATLGQPFLLTGNGLLLGVSHRRGGLSPGEWQNYTGFLAKLDEAISQADSAMTHTKQRTAAGQQEWLAKRGRVKAFDTLSDRHQSRLAYQDQRHEQKASDEHAARRHGEKEKD